MYFDLCLALGYAHPDHLLSQLTSPQLTDWLAYMSIYPIGERRADIRQGYSTALLCRAWGADVQTSDCIIDYEAAHKPDKPIEEVAAETKAFFAALRKT